MRKVLIMMDEYLLLFISMYLLLYTHKHIQHGVVGFADPGQV